MGRKKAGNEWPGPPSHLSQRSKELWKVHVGDRVKSPGRITAFQISLEALDRADAAREILDVEGLTTTTKRSGVVHVHPLLKVEKEARHLFYKIWSGLGLTWDQQIDGGHIL
jgi:phage terminase small subunit